MSCHVVGGAELGGEDEKQQVGARLPEPAPRTLQAAAAAELYQYLSWPLSHGAAVTADMISHTATFVVLLAQ